MINSKLKAKMYTVNDLNKLRIYFFFDWAELRVYSWPFTHGPSGRLGDKYGLSGIESRLVTFKTSALPPVLFFLSLNKLSFKTSYELAILVLKM